MGAQLFVNGTSWLHTMDPRAKIIALLGALILTLVFTNPLFTGALFAIYTFIAISVGGWSNLRGLLLVLIGIQGAALVMWPIFRSGPTEIFWWISEEGLLFALAMGFRLNAMVTAGIILLTTTSIEHLAWALVRLGLPYRLGFAITTAIRLVPMLIGSARTIAEAQASRGLNFQAGSLLTRIRRYVPLIVPVFMSSLRRANDFSVALEARAFSNPIKRSSYFQSKLTSKDFAVDTTIFLILLFSVVLSYFGIGRIAGLQ